MRKDPALVDIGDQNHRAIHCLGKAHIGNISGAQIDFCRGAGTFNQYDVVLMHQTLMRVQHCLERCGFVGVVGHCVHATDRMAVDDHLRAHIAIRLEQYRIHIRVRLQMGGLSLHCLGAANFTTIYRHRRVKRHILRLERGHLYSAMPQPAAKRSDQSAFARIRSGALDHQGAHVFALERSG